MCRAFLPPGCVFHRRRDTCLLILFVIYVPKFYPPMSKHAPFIIAKECLFRRSFLSKISHPPQGIADPQTAKPCAVASSVMSLFTPFYLNLHFLSLHHFPDNLRRKSASRSSPRSSSATSPGTANSSPPEVCGSYNTSSIPNDTFSNRTYCSR